MIKISDLKVKGFKSLIDTSVDEYGDVNMVYGFNNSGKSNIFKFLTLLFEQKKKGTKVKFNIGEEGSISKTQSNTLIEKSGFWNGYIWNEPFLFTKNKRDQPIQFEISLNVSNDLFPQAAELSRLEFLGVDSTIVKLIGQISSIDIETSELKIKDAFLNDKQFFKHEDEVDTFFDGIKSRVLNEKVGESILEIFNDLVLFIDSDRNLTIEASKDGVTTLDVKNFKNALYEMEINAEQNERFDKLIKFLSEFKFSQEAIEKLGNNIQSFPFNAETNIGFSKFEKEIEIMLRNTSGRYPLKNFGTGIQQFLYILTMIFNNRARIIIIEELELNLSPLYQKELLRFLKLLAPRYYDQLIFSSHSPFFTQKDSTMVDVIQHVRIDFIQAGGTSVDCHNDLAESYDETTGHSYLSFLYS